jgi:5-methylcytosine-specific restriction endonuclease McrA
MGKLNSNYGRGLIGKDNPNWRGGVSKKEYSAFYKRNLAPKVRELFTSCQICGTKENLEVHHIDSDRHNNIPTNLITLCHRCNIDDLWGKHLIYRAKLHTKWRLEFNRIFQ